MSAQAGESSKAVWSSPSTSASSSVWNVAENAALMAVRDDVIELMAPGMPVRPDTPWAVSSIVATSLSSVLESSSMESLTAWPDSVSGAPSPVRSSTRSSVAVLASPAAISSPSLESDDRSLNCSVTLLIESVHEVIALQKPSAHSSVGEAEGDSSLPPQPAATSASAATAVARSVLVMPQKLSRPSGHDGQNRKERPARELANACRVRRPFVGRGQGDLRV